MRIASANLYDSTVENLTRQQSQLTDMQEQLSSQLRVRRASDDPTAAARAERALASGRRIEASQRAVDASKTAMTLTESALGDAGDLLQRARELVVAGGNGSYSDSERAAIVTELKGIREQLLAVANRTDGYGQPLFGGQGASGAPFVDAPGGVQYQATGGHMQLAGVDGLPASVDGAVTWMQAPSGNGVFETSPVTSNGSAWVDAGRVTDPTQLTGKTYTVVFDDSSGSMTYSVLADGAPTALTGVAYTSGSAIQIDGLTFTIKGTPQTGDTFQAAPSTPTLGVFDALDRTISDLSATNPSGGQIAQAASSRARDLDQVMARLQSVRGQVGGTLNRLDTTTERLEDAKLATDTERSEATGLDMVAAISEFQNRQTSYDAALKSYAAVQKLSLFSYINT